MTNTLTIKDLRVAGACEKQVKLFEQHFGDGGTVTLAKVRKVASLFDWNWAARYLLSPARRAEYERVRDSALAEYERVRAPALAEYEGIRASALAEYEHVRAPAWAEYKRVRAPAWAEYERFIASAWFAGWKKDHEK